MPNVIDKGYHRIVPVRCKSDAVPRQNFSTASDQYLSQSHTEMAFAQHDPLMIYVGQTDISVGLGMKML